MEKIDLKKSFIKYYNASKKQPELIEIPEFTFLMIDGEGAPASAAFQKSVQALFSVAYKTKFTAKKTLDKDYVVMPLEGLWWAEDMISFEEGHKDNWIWTLMIHQPDFITLDIVQKSVEHAIKKLDSETPQHIRLEKYKEGLSAQLMHVGPFSEEGPNIQRIHQYVEENNGSFDGTKHKHHEIYLSDFRRTSPEKLKTILRQPFTPV